MNETEWTIANETVRLQVAIARTDFLKANYGPGKIPGGLTDAQIAKAEIDYKRARGFRLPGETTLERMKRQESEKLDDATVFAHGQFRVAFMSGAAKIEPDEAKARKSIDWHEANGSSLSVEGGGMEIAPLIDLPRAPFTKLLDDMAAGKPGIKLEPIPAEYLRAAAAAAVPKAAKGRRRRDVKPPAIQS